jgi:hypothetical protein
MTRLTSQVWPGGRASRALSDPVPVDRGHEDPPAPPRSAGGRSGSGPGARVPSGPGAPSGSPRGCPHGSVPGGRRPGHLGPGAPRAGPPLPHPGGSRPGRWPAERRGAGRGGGATLRGHRRRRIREPGPRSHRHGGEPGRVAGTGACRRPPGGRHAGDLVGPGGLSARAAHRGAPLRLPAERGRPGATGPGPGEGERGGPAGPRHPPALGRAPGPPPGGPGHQRLRAWTGVQRPGVQPTHGAGPGRRPGSPGGGPHPGGRGAGGLLPAGGEHRLPEPRGRAPERLLPPQRGLFTLGRAGSPRAIRHTGLPGSGLGRDGGSVWDGGLEWEGRRSGAGRMRLSMRSGEQPGTIARPCREGFSPPGG